MPPIRNEPMFAAPAPPELKLSKALACRKRGKDEKVSYAKYRTVKRVQCDECVWVLHEAGGKGWSINGATAARKDESGERLLLCHPHEQLWKKRDGVGEPKPKRGRGQR